MKNVFLIAIVTILCGCNSMYIKPNSLEKGTPIMSNRGGFSMQKSIKEEMENRGYDVRVGRVKTKNALMSSDGNYGYEIEAKDFNNVRYVVNVDERKESFSPLWCIFNGFWWWNFNISIADQESGEEIFAWRGRGCQNSSINKLNDALDKLERAPSEKKKVWPHTDFKY